MWSSFQGLYSDRYALILASLTNFCFKTHVNILHVVTGIVFVGTVFTRC